MFNQPLRPSLPRSSHRHIAIPNRAAPTLPTLPGAPPMLHLRDWTFGFGFPMSTDGATDNLAKDAYLRPIGRRA